MEHLNDSQKAFVQEYGEDEKKTYLALPPAPKTKWVLVFGHKIPMPFMLKVRRATSKGYCRECKAPFPKLSVLAWGPTYGSFHIHCLMRRLSIYKQGTRAVSAISQMLTLAMIRWYVESRPVDADCHEISDLPHLHAWDCDCAKAPWNMVAIHSKPTEPLV